VVVWDSSNLTNTQDGDGTGVFGQLFDTSGQRLGSEFQINSYTSANQYGPRVSSSSTGSFVVSWQATGAIDGDSHGVFARRFASDASALGSEFQVNSYTTSFQYRPAIAHLSSDEFVIVWTSAGVDGQSTGVAAQRFTSTGTPLGSEFVVNPSTAGAQYSADVSASAQGFVVSWTSKYAGANASPVAQVKARLFDNSGLAVSDEFAVSIDSTSNQEQSRAVFVSPQLLAIAWQGEAQDGIAGDIVGQLFTTDFSAPPLSPCGDPLSAAPVTTTATALITASDALFILRAAVGILSCEPCICDVNGSASITATDALTILRVAVGQPFELNCPPCS